MFSSDGGETWSERIDIYPGLSSGYTDITPIGPNRLLYVHDVVSNDPIGSSNWDQNWVNAIDIEFNSAPARSIQEARRGAIPYQAMGIKIGEVTADSAQIWTRLTRNRDANAGGVEFLGADTKAASAESQFPEGKVLADMERSVPRGAGEIKLIYWPEYAPDERKQTMWMPVDPKADFTGQF